MNHFNYRMPIIEYKKRKINNKKIRKPHNKGKNFYEL